MKLPNWILGLFLLALSFNTNAQSTDFDFNLDNLLNQNQENWQLTEADLANYQINSSFTDQHNQVTHVYLNQVVEGYPVRNAIINLSVLDGKLIHANSRFLSKAAEKVVAGKSRGISAQAAAAKALAIKSVETNGLTALPSKTNEANLYEFSSPNVDENGIRLRKIYTHTADDKLVLCWDVSFFPTDQNDLWSLRISVEDGSLVENSSLTLHCNMEHIASSTEHTHGLSCISQEEKQSTMTAADGATYRVVALPAESPIHGPTLLLTDPADPISSPYGWHDTNGQDGAEFTTTRGNNANVRLDRDGDYTADREIDGGDDLIFDYSFDDFNDEPTAYENASTTNLFYMVNSIHDFVYAYGFDEASGNFQSSNYITNLGVGNDHVNAFAQYGADAANINNADFSTPEEGQNGQMRMFLWNTRDDISVFSVQAPANLAGVYVSGLADFGETIGATALISEVVIVDDESGIGSDGCQPIQNGAAIAGKIALIDRGTCEFGAKVLNAEQNGAIGAIICNNRAGGAIGMAPGADGAAVTIPSVSLSQLDCDIIRVAASNGLVVKFERPDVAGPDRVDGSLDNGIIAHEFGHGISTRLTGGALNSGCLGGEEQMGEGWSDYFALVMTVDSGDLGTDKRGIGTYATREGLGGNGIRQAPYSTDFALNDLTYYDSYDASQPHGVGAVWATMLWEMYWELVDKNGFDPDLTYGTGGNNLAVQLVMDGMKMQPCRPGFVDGRDAILAADLALTAGENQFAIWSAFARRGLGQYADQGSSGEIQDGKEDYSIPIQWIPTVKVVKEMTPLILRGEDIEVKLTVRNDTEDAIQGTVISDEVPENTSVILNSVPLGFELVGNSLMFEIGALNPGEVKTYTYKLSTPDRPSILRDYSDYEDENEVSSNWIDENLIGTRNFRRLQGVSNSGDFAFLIDNVSSEQDQALLKFIPTTLEGEQPMMRFAHKYEVEDGGDGLVVEVSTDEATTFQDVTKERIFRNSYDNRMLVETFGQPDIEAFTGTQEDWKFSYVDLSDFRGQELYYRLRFKSNGSVGGVEYAIDDFTLFDARTYNSEVCLSYIGIGSDVCAQAADFGTIVEPEADFSSTEDFDNSELAWNVFPNPANDYIDIVWDQKQFSGSMDIQITDIKGSVIISKKVEDAQGKHSSQINISKFPAGMYIVELTSSSYKSNRKIIKN